MRVACVGGGPGGLYLAILMAKARRGHEITVLERNGADETFGWGVVFSDETLEGLREADAPTFDAITARFERWEDIDVIFAGRTQRSGGHGFAGVSRRALLGVLQERCRELGVEVRHRVEVDPHRLPEADLVVAADGVNSAVRRGLSHAFRPRVEPGRSPFTWLGTTRRFEAFTFIVRDCGHGIVQVHAYRFEPGTSTFIVETDEATWARAGLDRMPMDEGVAWCEALFAPELDGHRLLTNKSSWIRFQTVSCETWSHGNVILLGDACHTAHFSIGSGTKLAMEDAIALAAALDESPSLTEAFARYEAARRPVVERTQAVAAHSRTWFEEIARHARQPPEAFAYSLLTRSKQLDHERLAVRDPAYVEAVDRWHAASCGDPREPPPPPLFVPLRVRSLRLRNRVVVSPMCQYSAIDGIPGDWHLVHLGSMALGGAGLVMAEMTDVAPDARISPGCAGLWSEDHARAWRRITEFVHERTGAAIGIQVAHAGRKGSTRLAWDGMDEPLEAGWPVIAPSPIPFGPRSPVPRQMTREDLARVRREFERAARLATQAGFDVLELHAAHGYLLGSFISPLSNRRTDEHGGPLEARLRWPLEVFSAVRDAFPPERPVMVRISASDWLPGGVDADEAVEIARAFGRAGCDVIDVSSGGTTPDSRPRFAGRMYQVPLAERIRSDTGLLTAAVGNITTPAQANTILAAGRADLVVLARQHLRDPHFTLRAAEAAGWTGDGDLWPVQRWSARPAPRTPAP